VGSNDDLLDSFFGWLAGVMQGLRALPATVVANTQVIPAARGPSLPRAVVSALSPTGTALGG
jgi:hypothetical protein